MNPLLEIWLVAARDCRKNIRSFKGLVMLGIALFGAFVSTFHLSKIDELAEKAKDLSADQLAEVKANAFGQIYGDEAGKALAGAPVRLVVLFAIAVWLAPLLVMIVGFDGIPADRQYRSIRYWTIRTRRASYYLGKFLALWIIIGLVTLIMQLLVWGVTVVRADAGAGETITWGVRLWATSLPITGAWCGIATFVSSAFRTPMLSLLATAATFFVLFFVGLILARLNGAEQLRFFYPNNFDQYLLGSTAKQVLEGLGLCFAYIVGTAGLGSFVLMQRDV